jgi:hypothetical protein
MSTEAQVNANRINAQSSTGPRTEQGKQASSQNAYKHGLRSMSPTARGEDPAVWEAFAMEVIAELDPVGVGQRLLAERIAFLQWKLLRVPEAEAVQLATTRQALRQRAGDRDVPLYPSAALLVVADLNQFTRLQNYELRLQRALAAAQSQYRQLKSDAAKAKAEAMKAESAASKAPATPPPAKYPGFPDLRPGIPPAPSPWGKPGPDQQLGADRVRSAAVAAAPVVPGSGGAAAPANPPPAGTAT